MATTHILLPVLPVETITTNSGGTRYFNYYAPTIGYVTEAEAQCSIPKCRVKRFTARVTTNEVTSITMTLMKNGVSTGLSLSWGAGETGTKTVTGDIAFEQQDTYSIRYTWTQTSGSKTTASYNGVIEYGNY